MILSNKAEIPKMTRNTECSISMLIDSYLVSHKFLRIFDLLSKSLETQWFTTDAFSLVARRSLGPTSVEGTSMQLAASSCFFLAVYSDFGILEVWEFSYVPDLFLLWIKMSLFCCYLISVFVKTFKWDEAASF